MKTFEELLQQAEIDFCVSGHNLDTSADFEQISQFYRELGYNEKPNTRFIGGYVGSVFLDNNGKLRIEVISSCVKREEQAENKNVYGLKTHIQIHPAQSGDNDKEGEFLLRRTLEYHVQNKLPATCYSINSPELQGVNKP